MCPYCTGFHTGWITWIGWGISNGSAAPSGPFVAGTVAFAFASSAVCYAVDTIIQWFERE
jgi:4-hydroxybenzoate polyprenyltransferase